MNKEVEMTADVGMRQRGMAFPLPMSQIVYPNGCSRGDSGQYGMTMRQWYAGMALQGLMSNPETINNPFEAANFAFKYADAMISREENKTKTETPDV